MILNDINLSLRYYDDKKGRHQSHEMNVDGLECVDMIHVTGYGYDKDDAANELNNNINEYISYLEEVIKQMRNIQYDINDGKYKTLESRYK